ncbi:unnamed protein product, partial [Prorocentrum cordatum]
MLLRKRAPQINETIGEPDGVENCPLAATKALSHDIINQPIACNSETMLRALSDQLGVHPQTVSPWESKPSMSMSSSWILAGARRFAAAPAGAPEREGRLNIQGFAASSAALTTRARGAECAAATEQGLEWVVARHHVDKACQGGEGAKFPGDLGAHSKSWAPRGDVPGTLFKAFSQAELAQGSARRGSFSRPMLRPSAQTKFACLEAVEFIRAAKAHLAKVDLPAAVKTRLLGETQARFAAHIHQKKCRGRREFESALEIAGTFPAEVVKLAPVASRLALPWAAAGAKPEQARSRPARGRSGGLVEFAQTGVGAATAADGVAAGALMSRVGAAETTCEIPEIKGEVRFLAQLR